jgi:hypothetical protein
LFIRCGFAGVLSAIEFNHQAPLEAAEVGDERTDDELAAEFKSNELARTETCPQLTFRVCLFAAQSTGALFKYGGAWFHCASTLTLTLSQRERGLLRLNRKSAI